MSDTLTSTLPTLTMPKHIISLSTSGCLIQVEQHCITFTKASPKTGEKASRDIGASINLYNVSAQLFKDNPVLDNLLNHRQTIYNWLKDRLYPWADGQFYCPTELLAPVIKEFEAHKVEREKRKREWGEVYEEAIGAMILASNSAFTRAMYPSKDAMLARFTLDMIISEVPVGDFRNALSHELAQDLFANLSRQHDRALSAMLSKQCEQLLKVMNSLSHCCELVQTTDKDGKVKTKRRKLYDSTLQDALDYVRMFEEFNPSGNPQLEAARSALARALDGVTIDTLRESDTLRTVVKESVDDILKVFTPDSSIFG